MVEKPAPFVLLFAGGLLESLRRKYKIGLRGGHPKVFLENARRQNINVSEMGKEELDEWKSRVEKLGRDDHQLAKDIAKVALFGPGAAKMPMQVTKALKFEDSKSVVLIFNFSVGSIFGTKSFILGTMVFPSTPQGKEDVFQYFRNLVSEAWDESQKLLSQKLGAICPISEKIWKRSEKTRKKIASKAPDIEGLEENLWKKIL